MGSVEHTDEADRLLVGFRFLDDRDYGRMSLCFIDEDMYRDLIDRSEFVNDPEGVGDQEGNVYDHLPGEVGNMQGKIYILLPLTEEQRG